MSVTGASQAVRGAYGLPSVARPASPRPAAPAPAESPPVEVGRLPSAPLAPDSVPAGSDPALWAVLTSDERSFFARQAALGPLRYGPRSTAPAADAPLGQRIDVRA
jgi:hypothetical protein